MHWAQWMRKPRPQRRPPLERFIQKLHIETDGCWRWTGSLDRKGYGGFNPVGVRVQAHRWAYEQFVGSIPDGLQLDHLCRKPACVNPAHLEPVTPRENSLRGEGFAAIRALVTMCPKGHPYDEVNTYVCPNGTRSCRACRRESMAAFRARRRAAAE